MPDVGGRHDLIASLFAAPWLGHGRAIECFLAIVAGLYGSLLLLIPEAAFDSKATVDIAWLGYGQYLALPLIIKASLTGTGLLLNIRGMRYSRQFRFLGALLGTLIWIFLAAKFLVLGLIASVGFPFCAPAALFSVRIMGMALADLPRPGAPGAM
jgi:hypothetical protein